VTGVHLELPWPPVIGGVTTFYPEFRRSQFDCIRAGKQMYTFLSSY
jgi:hypothetical protein